MNVKKIIACNNNINNIEKISFKKGDVIPNTNYNNISLISSESESYPKKNENFLI